MARKLRKDGSDGTGIADSGGRRRRALREAVCDTLELAGQTVDLRGGGDEALQLLARHAVSLVVSDVRMLPVDGITLLKEIRSRHAAAAGRSDDRFRRRRPRCRSHARRRL
jgi:CheY-like chemotaxis protein